MSAPNQTTVNPSAAVCGGGMPCPVLLVDTREQKPLTFEHLRTRSCTLHTGDYSIERLESRYTVERKSVPDLVGTLTRRRDAFLRELDRMRGYDFARLLIIGTHDELLRVLSSRKVSESSILGSLSAIDARGVPVVWRATPEQAARQIESWAWYYYTGLSKALTGKNATAPDWARAADYSVRTNIF